MSQNRKSSVTGQWKRNGEEIVWEEVTTTEEYNSLLYTWEVKSKTPVLKTPESQGLTKSVDLGILFKETRPNPRKFRSQETVLFLENLKIRIREDRKYVYLKWSDESNKLFLADLYHGQTYQCPLESTKDIIVSKVDKEPIFVDEEFLKSLKKDIETKRYKIMYFDSKTESGEYGISVQPRR